MLYLYRSLGLAAVISTLVTASPVDQHARLDSREDLLELGKRQDANTDDLETDAATDPLRDGKYRILSPILTSTDFTISHQLRLCLLCSSDRDILCGFHRGLAK